jgi:hypothetical protein
MSIRGYIWCAIAIFDVIALYQIITTAYALMKFFPNGAYASIGG